MCAHRGILTTIVHERRAGVGFGVANSIWRYSHARGAWLRLALSPRPRINPFKPSYSWIPNHPGIFFLSGRDVGCHSSRSVRVEDRRLLRTSGGPLSFRGKDGELFRPQTPLDAGLAAKITETLEDANRTHTAVIDNVAMRETTFRGAPFAYDFLFWLDAGVHRRPRTDTVTYEDTGTSFAFLPRLSAESNRSSSKDRRRQETLAQASSNLGGRKSGGYEERMRMATSASSTGFDTCQ
jgi:hypothetical protein